MTTLLGGRPLDVFGLPIPALGGIERLHEGAELVFDRSGPAGALATLPDVRDGDTAIALSVRQLAPSGTMAFTIDVDDTLDGREITVTNGEIEDATVWATAGGATSSGTFTGAGTATVSLDGCADGSVALPAPPASPRPVARPASSPRPSDGRER